MLSAVAATAQPLAGRERTWQIGGHYVAYEATEPGGLGYVGYAHDLLPWLRLQGHAGYGQAQRRNLMNSNFPETAYTNRSAWGQVGVELWLRVMHRGDHRWYLGGGPLLQYVSSRRFAGGGYQIGPNGQLTEVDINYRRVRAWAPGGIGTLAYEYRLSDRSRLGLRGGVFGNGEMGAYFAGAYYGYRLH